MPNDGNTGEGHESLFLAARGISAIMLGRGFVRNLLCFNELHINLTVFGFMLA